MIFFVFSLSFESKTPILDYFKSDKPYSLCNAIKSNATLLKEKKFNKYEIKEFISENCQKYDKLNKGMCKIFVNNWFDHILDTKLEDSCQFSKETKRNTKDIKHKIIRKPRKTHPEPLSVLDCTICEMVVGFVIEQGTGTIATPKTGEIIRNKCKEVASIKDHCSIFTEDVVSSMISHLASNLHPFELCTFYGSCP